MQRRRLLVVLIALALGIGVIVAAVIVITAPPPLTPAEIAARAARVLLAKETKSVNRAKVLVAAQLPTNVGAAAPAPTGALFVRPLAAHQVMGFVPYWELGALDTADFADASDLVYSGVCPAPNGSLSETSTDCHLGLSDLTSPAFASMLANARLAHDQVLLSVTTASDAVIEALDAHPVANADRLAAAVEKIVEAHTLDGVNLDLEGTKAVDAARFATFVADLVARLRAADPTGAVVLDAYASSAAPGPGFFNLHRLAPLVDEVFLMAYDMENPQTASASSPLKSPTLGFSVVQSLMQYEKFIPARKIVLGMPFYGNDFATVSGSAQAAATMAPKAFSYDAIVKAGKVALWDVASDTPYSRFKRAGAWHEIWFDDPVSLALKTALGADFKIAGVGAWAFGMEGSADGMVAALDGGAAPEKSAIPISP